MNISIEINGKKYEAQHRETILEVLNRNGIKVPTLCHMKGFIPSGACRICVVEIEGSSKLISSCSYPVSEGMKILTHSPRVIEARKTIVELLLSNHPDDCLYCVRNTNCELQNLAKEYHVIERRIFGSKNNFKTDFSSVSIVRNPNKCILCGRCVRVCEEIMGVSCIEYTYRGSKTCIGTTLQKGLNTSSCVNCGQCIMVCPTGALSEKNQTLAIKEVLGQKNKTVVVQYAPAISVSIAEAFGLEAGKDINGILNAALRKIGFDYVFDTSFAADLTIMEESAELIERIKHNKNLPMFTSCCPAWIKFAEEYAPEFLPNISTCKSPQQMMGAIIKSFFAKKKNISPEQIFSVSIMPCTAKKFEAQRETMSHNGISDVDLVITTRELIELIRVYGINMNQLEPEMTDTPFGIRSTAGKIFATSGGVTEAAIRTLYKELTNTELQKFKINEVRGFEGRKEMKLNINGKEIGIAVVSGLKNAAELITEIKNGRNDIHFIEIMSCPGGCIAGGGQIIGSSKNDIELRMKSLYHIDETENLKLSHKNPEVSELYSCFLEKPLSHKSHELLHTKYEKRDVLL
ncbi:MAG: NADH-dependent [FeFe] hydrogenase, group A6 [Bacteroidales bacterium]|nr:NADH-dependent [FeFe] hydrogenase, group A6 [Bacteroidales bacterium]